MMSRGSLLFLRSVGQRSRSQGHGNIKCCPDDNSRTLGPRIMKLHRELGYDEQRKPIVFEVSRSKVKVTKQCQGARTVSRSHLQMHQGGHFVFNELLSPLR